MRDIIFLDGSFIERKDARVSIEDRGFQFADGVYEVTKFYGRRPLRLDDHLARLEKSAAYLRIEGAPTADEWREIIAQLMDECEIGEDDNEVRGLYQQITRGDTPRNHYFPVNKVSPTSIAYFRSVALQSPETRASGIELSTQPDERWERCYIKSICLLPAILAKQAAREAGAFEAILVRNGFITEGGSTNIFCVINGEIHTHPTGPHILSGITREIVLEAAAKLAVNVIERPVPMEEFQRADEAFICSTTLDVLPAVRIDGQPIADGKAGVLTLKIAEAVNAIIKDEISQPV